jgi:hypothetical protein
MYIFIIRPTLEKFESAEMDVRTVETDFVLIGLLRSLASLISIEPSLKSVLGKKFEIINHIFHHMLFDLSLVKENGRFEQFIL